MLIGLFTTAALADHGALYPNWKTDGPVQERSRAPATLLGGGAVLLVLATAATAVVQPRLFARSATGPGHGHWCWRCWPAWR